MYTHKTGFKLSTSVHSWNRFYIEAEPGAVCATAVVWCCTIAWVQVILEDSALTNKVTVSSVLYWPMIRSLTWSAGLPRMALRRLEAALRRPCWESRLRPPPAPPSRPQMSNGIFRYSGFRLLLSSNLLSSLRPSPRPCLRKHPSLLSLTFMF